MDEEISLLFCKNRDGFFEEIEISSERGVVHNE